MKPVLILFGIAITFGAVGCSSTPYKTQEYAKLQNAKEFEDEYPAVWRGVVDAVGEYKLEDKDQEKGLIVTDWIYSTSTDKYFEYQVNGFPRKRYLQTRYKFQVNIEKQIGKVRVTVLPLEELENLKTDGTFESWRSVTDFDTGRANDMIKNIEMKILSRPDALNK